MQEEVGEVSLLGKDAGDSHPKSRLTEHIGDDGLIRIQSFSNHFREQLASEILQFICRRITDRTLPSLVNGC